MSLSSFVSLTFFVELSYDGLGEVGALRDEMASSNHDDWEILAVLLSSLLLSSSLTGVYVVEEHFSV